MEAVPLQAKIWMKKYDVGCILLAKDIPRNKYLVLTQSHQKWIVEYNADEKTLILVKNLSIVDGTDRNEEASEETCQEACKEACPGTCSED